jgi:hypothetical protein
MIDLVVNHVERALRYVYVRYAPCILHYIKYHKALPLLDIIQKCSSI